MIDDRAPRPGDADNLWEATVTVARRHKQRDLALLMGVSEARISQLLRGQNPTLRTIDDILVSVAILEARQRPRRAGGRA